MEAKKSEDTEKQRLQDERTIILTSIQQVNDGITIADELVVEGNSELKKIFTAEECLKKGTSKSPVQNRNRNGTKTRALRTEKSPGRKRKGARFGNLN